MASIGKEKKKRSGVGGMRRKAKSEDAGWGENKGRGIGQKA